MTEEEFLNSRGAGMADLGDPGLHKTHSRLSRKQWSRLVRQQQARDDAWLQRREELRAEYERLVAAGEIRPPTRRERLEKTAAGHPDNESVQAARRLLTKYYPPEG